MAAPAWFPVDTATATDRKADLSPQAYMPGIFVF